jgi:DNA-binding SARP family transcriptional activator
VTGASLSEQRIDYRESQARHMANGPSVKPPHGKRIRLRTLGKAALVEHAEGRDPVEILGPGKPLALLAYLTRSPQRTASRDHLLDLLWADHPPDAARHALRQAVWYLRKRIGDEALEAGDGSVRLVGPLETDDLLFETAVAEVDLQRAIDCYHGPFLPDLAVPGGARLEQWADSVRGYLQSLFFRTAEVVVRQWLSAGRTREARALATRVRDTNPLEEVGWRLLLEALCSAGDWVTAGVTADELERLLAREGRRPEPATTAALRRARQIAPAVRRDDAAATTLVTELVGREREFATVTLAWARARQGPGRHIHISGGAGLGKTRLLQDLHSRLLTVGARVVYVNANPGTRHVGYSYASDLAQALAQLPGAASISPACASILVGLNPALSSVYDRRADSSQHDATRKYLIALKDLLAGIADEQPVALFVDDLHWIDRPSLSLLSGLIGSVADSRVLLVTTSRSTLNGFGTDDQTKTIELEPLSPDNVFSLLSSLGALPDEPWAESITTLMHRATGGSPLLILETLQLSLEQGKLGLERGEWTCPDPDALWAELEEGGALRRRIAELQREQSWILLLLAAAGTPLSRTVLAELVHRPGESFESDLIELEKKGFIARTGDEYRVAHDEIAELALDGAPPEARTAAYGTMGRVLLDYGWNDLGLLTQAGPYLAHAGDNRRLRTALRRKVWLTRSRGDRRSLEELARETTGTMGSNGAAAKLVKQLPLYMRLGLSSARRVTVTAAAGAVLMIGALAAWLAPSGPPADMNFMLFEDDFESTRQVFAAELRREGWDQLSYVKPSRGLQRTGAVFQGRYVRAVTPRPGGAIWALAHESGDTGGIDIYLSDGADYEERLTFAPGDDKPWSWSPDGRQLAITTARWSDHSFYDLAVLDMSAKRLRQLTATQLPELQPVWSPDGTRIAFARMSGSAGAAEICWTAADGATSSCLPLPERQSFDLLTWPYESTVFIRATDLSGQRWIESVDMDSREVARIGPSLPERTSALSPDSKWVTCYCQDQTGMAQWRIYPLDDPTQSRPVDVNHNAPEGLLPVWLPTQDPHHYLDRIALDVPLEAPLGVPLLLRFLAWDGSGQPVTPDLMRWMSLDTSLALADAQGLLLAKRAGEVDIAGSAGGWRADTATITVVERSYRLLLEEDWLDGDHPQWRFYGDPDPRLVQGPDSVPAFWNANDEKYTSGAYSRAEWSVTRGLGVEARVATPITVRDQQVLDFELEGNLDADAIEVWDHRYGYLPGSTEYTNRRCDAGIRFGPDQEGIYLTLGAAGQRTNTPVRLPIGSTQWYDFRLQLFPDGTCGLAINGSPVARTESKIPLDGTYRVITEGRSRDTQVLVGPLQVWQGVKTDVDWSALDWPRQREPEAPDGRNPGDP